MDFRMTEEQELMVQAKRRLLNCYAGYICRVQGWLKLVGRILQK